MNAHVAIVFAGYMMLSVTQRENENDKMICELCFCLLLMEDLFKRIQEIWEEFVSVLDGLEDMIADMWQAQVLKSSGFDSMLRLYKREGL